MGGIGSFEKKHSDGFPNLNLNRLYPVRAASQATQCSQPEQDHLQPWQDLGEEKLVDRNDCRIHCLG